MCVGGMGAAAFCAAVVGEGYSIRPVTAGWTIEARGAERVPPAATAPVPALVPASAPVLALAPPSLVVTVPAAPKGTVADMGLGRPARAWEGVKGAPVLFLAGAVAAGVGAVMLLAGAPGVVPGGEGAGGAVEAGTVVCTTAAAGGAAGPLEAGCAGRGVALAAEDMQAGAGDGRAEPCAVF